MAPQRSCVKSWGEYIFSGLRADWKLKFPGNLCFLDIVLFPESFNTARSVYQLLFTREKRMTGGTNFHFQILYRRAGFDGVSTSTGYFGCIILGMNFLFHANPPLNSPNSFWLKTAKGLRATLMLQLRCSLSAGMLHYSWISSFCQPGAR